MDVQSALYHIHTNFKTFDQDKSGWLDMKELSNIANGTGGTYSQQKDREAAQTLLNNPEYFAKADKTHWWQSRDGQVTQQSLYEVAKKTPSGIGALDFSQTRPGCEMAAMPGWGIGNGNGFSGGNGFGNGNGFGSDNGFGGNNSSGLFSQMGKMMSIMMENMMSMFKNLMSFSPFRF